MTATFAFPVLQTDTGDDRRPGAAPRVSARGRGKGVRNKKLPRVALRVTQTAAHCGSRGAPASGCEARGRESGAVRARDDRSASWHGEVQLSTGTEHKGTLLNQIVRPDLEIPPKTMSNFTEERKVVYLNVMKPSYRAAESPETACKFGGNSQVHMPAAGALSRCQAAQETREAPGKRREYRKKGQSVKAPPTCRVGIVYLSKMSTRSAPLPPVDQCTCVRTSRRDGQVSPSEDESADKG
ncbi:hypothetical protein Bbelb_177120 [Branchiostoma belcheri]|nr:hypothetical protein Bbelb_177120 [Branchiostoma belcheri]